MSRLQAAILIPIIALLILIASAAGQTTRPAVEPSRLVLAWTPSLGGDAKRLGLDPLLIEQGWAAWVQRNIVPEIHWIRTSSGRQPRFVIHMPFGRSQTGGQFHLSEIFRCRELAPRVADREEFVAAWKPLIEDGAEVICYVGYFAGDPFFEQLYSTDRGAWLRSIAEALELPLAAGMSIAIDASSGLKPGEPGHRVIELLGAMGVRTYIETATAAAHWKGQSFIALDFLYEAHVRGNDEPKGPRELLIWCQQPPAGEAFSRAWADRMVRKYQGEGKTVIIPAGWLRHGVPGRADYE